jgi:hypothetical protein
MRRINHLKRILQPPSAVPIELRRDVGKIRVVLLARPL